MIFNYIYPPSRRGWWRRYMQFRRILYKYEWHTPDTEQFPPLALFDFTRDVDRMDAQTVAETGTDGWRMSDDRVIGGYTISTAALLQTTRCWSNHLERMERLEEGMQVDDGPTVATSDLTLLLARPYIRWSGTLDTTLPLESRARRSGFAALQSPTFPFRGANLGGNYNALEIQCRETIADVPRVYTLNLKINSSAPEDIYQGKFMVEPTYGEEEPFQTFVLPFDKLTLTANGRERYYPRRLDNAVMIESVGLALMDGLNGDFQLDVASVRAVNREEEAVTRARRKQLPSFVDFRNSAPPKVLPDNGSKEQQPPSMASLRRDFHLQSAKVFGEGGIVPTTG